MEMKTSGTLCILKSVKTLKLQMVRHTDFWWRLELQLLMTNVTHHLLKYNAPFRLEVSSK